ncbi:5-carboxymethyl-2-hydroxymuconate Delta-isomerase [Thalassotalea fusca]
MPHFVVEVSESVVAENSARSIIDCVKWAAIDSQLFEPKDIKCRLQSFQHFDCAHPELRFIHVVAKILTGRTLTQKKALSAGIIAQLQELGVHQVSITAEVVDIERESYAKHVTLSDQN